MEKVTSKHGKRTESGIHKYIKGNWASLEFTTPIAFEFVSGISSGRFPRRTTTVKVKASI